jgi:hypothetical protein
VGSRALAFGGPRAARERSFVQSAPRFARWRTSSWPDGRHDATLYFATVPRVGVPTEALACPPALPATAATQISVPGVTMGSEAWPRGYEKGASRRHTCDTLALRP